MYLDCCVHVGRCFRTFGNYLSHLRGACFALSVEAPPAKHPAIQRAMVAIIKRELFKQRPKMFIDRWVQKVCVVVACLCDAAWVKRAMVLNMVVAVSRGRETMQYAALWLISYLFLLRLPSEVGSQLLHARQRCD